MNERIYKIAVKVVIWVELWKTLKTLFHKELSCDDLQEESRLKLSFLSLLFHVLQFKTRKKILNFSIYISKKKKIDKKLLFPLLKNYVEKWKTHKILYMIDKALKLYCLKLDLFKNFLFKLTYL